MTTRAESLPEIMVKQIRDGAAAAVQDLSKGVVPIVLVLALIGPAYWVGRKVEAVQREQVQSAAAQAETAEAVKNLADTLTPLVYQLASVEAKVEAQEQVNRTLERDWKLLETRIKNLEIETEVRQRTGR